MTVRFVEYLKFFIEIQLYNLGSGHVGDEATVRCGGVTIKYSAPEKSWIIEKSL